MTRYEYALWFLFIPASLLATIFFVVDGRGDIGSLIAAVMFAITTSVSIAQAVLAMVRRVQQETYMGVADAFVEANTEQPAARRAERERAE